MIPLASRTRGVSLPAQPDLARPRPARRKTPATRTTRQPYWLPPGTEFLTRARPVGGLYFWCRLGHGLKERRLLQRATAAGVVFADGEIFYADEAGAHELAALLRRPGREQDRGRNQAVGRRSRLRT